MKKILKSICICLCGVFLLCATGCGNPIWKSIVTENAKKYVEEHYAEMGYEVERVDYQWRIGEYTIHFHSPTNIDGDFYLNMSSIGSVEMDTYSYFVAERRNTSTRLSGQYHEFMKEVFGNPESNYLNGANYEMGGWLWYDKVVGETIYPDGALLRKDLELNKTDYDVRALGELQGRITVFIKNVEPTYENVADILLETKRVAEENNAPFYVLTLNFKQEGSYNEWEFEEFLYADIYEENLVERVQKFYEDSLEVKN